MGKIHAAITGVEGYVPEYRLTNAELETMMETNDEWITDRTGIKERRIAKNPEHATSYMASQAVKRLLEKTGTSPDEIELTICCTVTADYAFPDTAQLINEQVGINNAFGFDLVAACSGFLFGLTTGASYVESGRYKKVIVVGADKMSSIMNYTDRSTSIIFGDGAAAVLLEPNTEGLGVRDSILRGDGAGKEFLRQKAGGSRHPATIETVTNKEHYIFQNGRPVFKAAVKGMSGVVKEIMERNELTAENVNWVVPHQANIRIIESVARMANFPIEKVMINIQKYGNTTAATIPLCLWEWQDKLRKGDNLILTAFGGGYTWGATHLVWAYDPMKS